MILEVPSRPRVIVSADTSSPRKRDGRRGSGRRLREALAPLAKRITAAFVYGSVAKRSDTAASDIDLLVVSDSLTYADLYAAMEQVTARLGREVNPAVYSRKELAKRAKQNKAFVTRVMAQPKIWLIGAEVDLAA